MAEHDLFGGANQPPQLLKKTAKLAEAHGKEPAAYRTISEAADELGVATHVLRFWETKFPEIEPLKKTAGRRYYRPEDMQYLLRIRDLLHHEGYTIRGVQALFKKFGKAGFLSAATAAQPALEDDVAEATAATLGRVLEQLKALKVMLNAPLG